MIFEVQSGGVTYEVEAPDQATAIQALQGLIKEAPKPANMAAGPVQSTETSVMGDMVKSAGSGLVSGTHALAGLPGDVVDMARGVGGWIGDRAREFAGKEALPGQAPDPLKLSSIPGTEDLESATGWDKAKYVPKTTAGEFANTAASFVPGAVALGGAGSVASKAMKLGVAPGVASEAAGQLTEGTALETPARVAGALVGAGGASALSRPKVPKAPTIDALKAEGQAAYDSASKQGVLISHNVFDQTVDDITRAAQKVGIDPAIHPKAYAALQRVNEAKGISQDLGDIDRLRQIINQAAKSIEPSERFMAGVMREKLDDFVENLKPGDVLAGNPNAAVADLLKGRSAWKKMRKAEVIEQHVRRADINKSQYTQSGTENALRTSFRQLARNEKKMRMFSKEEQAAIRKVADGTFTGNALRMLGKMAPRGVVSGGALTAVGFANPYLGALLWGIGETGKGIATAMTKGNARRASELVRSGGSPALPKSGSGLPGKGVPLGSYYLSNPGSGNRQIEPPGMVRDPLGRLVPALP